MWYCIGGDGGITAAVVGAAISSGATAATTGASIAAATTYTAGWSPSVVMEVTNYYNQALTNPTTFVHGGYISDPPATVHPGYEEGFGGHKVGGTATGTYGTVAWDLGNSGYHVVIMWSVPYDHNLHSNWLGIAIWPNINGYAHSYDDFERMYDHCQHWPANCVRGEYYHTVNQISIEYGGFYITGTMGTNYQPKAQIAVYPSDCSKLVQKYATFCN